MKEKEGKSITLNEKGALLVGCIILILVFSLGYATSKKSEQGKVTVFTRDDLDRIIELQELEDDRKSGAEIYVYKDKDGNLMIGWNYDDSKNGWFSKKRD